ncbi:T9SS type A sorting domain-containing protein [bacterium]|nr:T9SS type A sorting domain-containing protein [bacterium]
MRASCMISCFVAFLCMVFLSFPVCASVTGTVTDTSGNPVPGALITFADESNTDNYFLDYTDDSGRYEINPSPIFVDEQLPLPFTLRQNYPNPFNPSTTIPFSLSSPGNVKLIVYNVMGQHVKTLVDGFRSAGMHSVVWDGRSAEGKGLASGIYLYRLTYGDQSESRKMLLLDGGGLGIIIDVTHGAFFKSESTANKTSESFFTVTVIKGGYFDFEKKNINIDAISTYDITMTVCESIYNSDTSDTNGQISITNYEGATASITIKNAADEPVESVKVYTLSNTFGTTIICYDPIGEYFGTITHIPSNSEKPAPIIMWDFGNYTGEIKIINTKVSPDKVYTDTITGDVADQIWKSLQELPEKEPFWKQYGAKTYDGWDKITMVIEVIKTGTLSNPAGIILKTTVGEILKEITKPEYEKLIARINTQDNFAIVMNDRTLPPVGNIIGRITSHEGNVGIYDVEVSLTGQFSQIIDPVKSLWNGYYYISNLSSGSYTVNAQPTGMLTISVYQPEYLYGREGQDLLVGNVFISGYEKASIPVQVKSSQTSQVDFSLDYKWIKNLAPALKYRKAGETVFQETLMVLSN